MVRSIAPVTTLLVFHILSKLSSLDYIFLFYRIFHTVLRHWKCLRMVWSAHISTSNMYWCTFKKLLTHSLTHAPVTKTEINAVEWSAWMYWILMRSSSLMKRRVTQPENALLVSRSASSPPPPAVIMHYVADRLFGHHVRGHHRQVEKYGLMHATVAGVMDRRGCCGCWCWPNRDDCE